MDAETMYPKAMELAMDHAKPNFEKLRNHFGWTEAETTGAAITHTQLLKDVIPSGTAQDVHDQLTSGLTRTLVTEKDVEEVNRRGEAQRKEMLETGKATYGWAWDAVFKKAKDIVAAKPALVELLKKANAENNVTFWKAACKQAKIQLQREGKL